MKTLEISIPEKKTVCSATIGAKALERLPEFLKEHLGERKVAVVLDEAMNELHGERLRSYLPASEWVIVPPGEQAKSRDQKVAIEDQLLDKGFGRDSAIIAVGGGVIGDLAGFVAATFNRGIPILHVPTTLLAMVDSSIGGKTGINTPHGKNLIGATHQPLAIFTDTEFLKTLPEEEFLSGMAEIVKIAAARDKELFRFLERNLHDINARKPDVVEEMITKAITLKKEVVEQDEKESGLRQVLNLGHTIGHAIEAAGQYRIGHGRCVSMGLVAEARLSVKMGILSTEDRDRIITLTKDLRLPHTLAKAEDTDSLIGFMKTDKKAVAGKPYVVLLKEIGSIGQKDNAFSFPIEEDMLREAIEESRHD